VGIGSDLDGAALVDEITDASHWGKIADLLSEKHGYSDQNIEQVVGGNWLRLFS
jgi:microsomal dipeptidase-like Zn-dependent dipeptidase